MDELPNQNVPSYIAVDASLDWRPAARVKTSLTVRNLNDAGHVEFGGGSVIERSVYLGVDWDF